jgi:hypothetical protein
MTVGVENYGLKRKFLLFDDDLRPIIVLLLFFHNSPQFAADWRCRRVKKLFKNIFFPSKNGTFWIF